MLKDSEKSNILLGEHMLAMTTIMNYKLSFKTLPSSCKNVNLLI